jgi:hypothetical protein
MKKLFCLLIIASLCSNTSLLGQTLELAGGVNYNSFFTVGHDDPLSTVGYKSRAGYRVLAGYTFPKRDKITLRITLGLENYSGAFKSTSSGHGGSSITDGIISKNVLSLGVFPVNVPVFGGLFLSIGLEGSVLLNEKVSGWKYGISYSDTSGASSLLSLQDIEDIYSTRTTIGARINLSYEVAFGSRSTFSPHYSFYIGTRNELAQFLISTYSMRHFFGLAYKRTFRSRKKSSSN